MRSVREDAEAERERKVASRSRAKLLQALQICERVHGDEKVSQLAHKFNLELTGQSGASVKVLTKASDGGGVPEGLTRD